MLSGRDVSQVVDGIFREEVLILGGLLAVHQVPSAFIHMYLVSMERVRQRAHRRIRCRAGKAGGAADSQPPRLDRHPEIERFLARLGEQDSGSEGGAS